MNKKVLIIEDDHDIRVSLRLGLESKGFTVYSAASGLEGLDLLGLIETPELIILDLIMPLMDGEEFLQRKEVMPAIQDIPVLIMTGEPRASLKHYETLLKPFDLEILYSKIESLIRSSSSIKE